MPLCQVNLCDGHLAQPEAVERHLAQALASTPTDQPIIVLVHGYKHAPSSPRNTPHDHIFSLDPPQDPKAVSWPRGLGVTETTAREPLCIAMGWEARGSLWQAYGAAAEAGHGLARLVQLIRTLRPRAQVQTLAHSLGARVVLQALPKLPAGALQRAILLAAAELRDPAEACLRTEAGRALQVLSVTSRENRVYDRALGWLIAPHRSSDRPLSTTTPDTRSPWVNLPIHDADTLRQLGGLGYGIPAADRWMCHWSVYTRPGLFPLYRDVLSGALPLAQLAAILHQTARPTASILRWRPPAPLPFSGGEAS